MEVNKIADFKGRLLNHVEAVYRPGERDFPISTYGEELTKLAEERLRARGLLAILEPGRYVVAQSAAAAADGALAEQV